MCFIICCDDCVIKTAEEDIKVYKVLNSLFFPMRLVSPYYSVSWIPGEVMETQSDPQFATFVQYMLSGEDMDECISFGEGGYHSLPQIQKANELAYSLKLGGRENIVVMKAIIPKGSLYLSNGDECFSNRLMILP